MLAIAAVWWLVQALNAPSDTETARDLFVAYGPLIVGALGAVAVLLTIEAIQDRVFNQAQLVFLDPSVDDTTAFGRIVAVGPGGTPRFVGPPPETIAAGSNSRPYVAPPELTDPTFPWFLFLRVRNAATRSRPCTERWLTPAVP